MLIIDSFAGGGGASTGIEMALGRSPDIAINHNEVALEMHRANHPETTHLVENIWKVNIETHTDGEQVGLLWASPDCTHFSKARGGKPKSKSVRGLAWTIVRFVHDLRENRPLVICLENVSEFLTWEDFGNWKKELRRYGYVMQHRQLKACDYGAPTIRKRLFIIMRRDGEKIVWPAPTHGAPDSDAVRLGTLKPWKTAAEIIDWSIPCPSIFDTSEEIKEKYGIRAVRPLAENTMKRIAAGVKRYVLDAQEPFFVTYGQHGGQNRSTEEPLHTVTASSKDTNAIVLPSLISVNHGDSGGRRSYPVDAPLHTVTRTNGHALVAAFLAQHNTGVIGRKADSPLSTVTTTGAQQNAVAAHLINQKGSKQASYDARIPVPAICASTTHAGVIAAFLTKYYGNQGDPDIRDPLHTVTTKDRFGLITVNIEGESYVIADIGMRMLTPRELFRAQGFSDEYIIDRGQDGRSIGKTQQVQKCGNSVCPPVVEAIIAANCPELKKER